MKCRECRCRSIGYNGKGLMNGRVEGSMVPQRCLGNTGRRLITAVFPPVFHQSNVK